MNAEPLGAKAESQTDDELHSLTVQHHQLDDRLHELAAKSYLSEPEHIEEVTLKKKKLHLKDRMEDIMRRHRGNHPNS